MLRVIWEKDVDLVLAKEVFSSAKQFHVEGTIKIEIQEESSVALVYKQHPISLDKEAPYLFSFAKRNNSFWARFFSLQKEKSACFSIFSALSLLQFVANEPCGRAKAQIEEKKKSYVSLDRRFCFSPVLFPILSSMACFGANHLYPKVVSEKFALGMDILSNITALFLSRAIDRKKLSFFEKEFVKRDKESTRSWIRILTSTHPMLCLESNAIHFFSKERSFFQEELAKKLPNRVIIGIHYLMDRLFFLPERIMMLVQHLFLSLLKPKEFLLQ